jgi:ketosteroid isomerase-like protein
MSRENVEQVRRGLELWNDGDFDEFLAESPDDVEWVIAEENPNARTLRGRDEIADYLRDWTSTMPGLRFEVAEWIDAGDAVLTLGTVSGRAGADGPEIGVPIATVTYFEGDRPVRVEEYLDYERARAAAGVSG